MPFPTSYLQLALAHARNSRVKNDILCVFSTANLDEHQVFFFATQKQKEKLFDEEYAIK